MFSEVFWCFSTDQLIIEFTTDQYQAQSLVIECVMIWSVLIYSGITGQFDLSPIWTMSMHILLNPLILTLFCLTTASLKSFFSFLLKNITWYVLQVTRGLWESAWQMVSFKLLVCHAYFYTTWLSSSAYIIMIIIRSNCDSLSNLQCMHFRKIWQIWDKAMHFVQTTFSVLNTTKWGALKFGSTLSKLANMCLSRSFELVTSSVSTVMEFINSIHYFTSVIALVCLE